MAMQGFRSGLLGLHVGLVQRCSWAAMRLPAAASSQARLQSSEGGDGHAPFEQTTIANILEGKGARDTGTFLTITTEDTVYDAVKAMTSNNVGALLVMQPGDKEKPRLAGIVTERDYLRKIIVQGRSSKTTRVGDIMTEENKLITVRPDTKVLQAMQLMTDHRIRHIPVSADGRMLGMVSIGDVVGSVVAEHKQELSRLNDYIQGSY